MSDIPRLPPLPIKFGNDSPFPPVINPQSASARFLASASAPPLPPARDLALDREYMLRQREGQYASQSKMNSGGLRPGQIIPSLPYARQIPTAAAPHFGMVSSPMTAPSPIRMPTAQSQSPRLPPKNPVQKQSRAITTSQSPGIQRPSTTEPRIQSTKANPSSSPSPSTMYATKQDARPIVQSQRRHASSEDVPRIPLNHQHIERERDIASTVPLPELNVVLPNLKALSSIREAALMSGNDKRKLAWCKDVIKYVERKSEGTKINDPLLVQYIDEAIKTISHLASTSPPLAEALYLRGDLLASGSFPSYHRKDLKQAFSDFELSARMGHAQSWFRIGRDYEILGDHVRAKDAYRRGCGVRDVGCVYRMGMANLLGQLDLNMNHNRAIPLLREAADLANLDTPQPSYIYGMLVAGEFSHVDVDPRLLIPTADPAHPDGISTIELEAKRRIQRAAYLNFGPAQYRCGWSYEYALLECPFDPLLSVQYYSLASQAGEVEADLALSKWFLCGAEGCFDKNEKLAFTFAEKAANKGLPSAEFAMGYYFEVGVGCRKALDVAKNWYKKAAKHGNTDARERLAALQGPSPSSLSRTQHEVHVDTQLLRKRTEAKVKSDRRSKILISKEKKTENSRGGVAATHRPIDARKRMTMLMVEETAKKSHQPRSAELNSATNDFAYNRDKRADTRITSSKDKGTAQQSSSQSKTSVPSNARNPASRPSKQPNSSTADARNTSVSDYSDGKKFETFGEMGFSAKKAKDDKDCIIC